jgi:hypothetical protein
MATIDKRIMQDGTVAYRVRVRHKGYPPQVASFPKLSDAKKWAQIREGAVLAGRHFQTPKTKQHTLTDLVDRYICEVLPQKRPSTVLDQARQLRWWKTHLGHALLADITPAVLVELHHRTLFFY